MTIYYSLTVVYPLCCHDSGCWGWNSRLWGDFHSIPEMRYGTDFINSWWSWILAQTPVSSGRVWWDGLLVYTWTVFTNDLVLAQFLENLYLILMLLCKRPFHPPTLQWSVSTCNTVPQKSTSNWTPAQPAWNQDSCEQTSRWLHLSCIGQFWYFRFSMFFLITIYVLCHSWDVLIHLFFMTD
jgi:hypothetical protein